MATREEWLVKAGVKLASLLKEKAGLTVPEYYVSVGFPKGQRGRHRAIGQCFYGVQSADGKPHVFICPSQVDPLHILLHEQIHAALPVGVGHKGAFADACRKVGLVKPWTATTPGPELADTFAGILKEVGDYPHAALDMKTIKKQTTRMRLFECQCEPPVKLRAGRYELNATCNDCGADFELQEPKPKRKSRKKAKR